MKAKIVYILKHRYYNGTFGVFTTVAKAEARADRLGSRKRNKISRERFYIEEEILDRV